MKLSRAQKDTLAYLYSVGTSDCMHVASTTLDILYNAGYVARIKPGIGPGQMRFFWQITYLGKEALSEWYKAR